MLCQVDLRVVSADGQTLRASKTNKLKAGKYILNFYDTDNRVVLGQKLIGEKENETTHASLLVEGFDLRGRVVTQTHQLHRRNLLKL